MFRFTLFMFLGLQVELLDGGSVINMAYAIQFYFISILFSCIKKITSVACFLVKVYLNSFRRTTYYNIGKVLNQEHCQADMENGTGAILCHRHRHTMAYVCLCTIFYLLVKFSANIPHFCFDLVLSLYKGKDIPVQVKKSKISLDKPRI